MSQTTIGWTAVQDARGRWLAGYTFNPWKGCTKVSTECKHCYAEGMDVRFWGGTHWGPSAARELQSSEYWQKPVEWNRRALAQGVRLRVFCGSVCDWLEDREDLVEARRALLELIDRTPGLDWLMLTKRPENLLRLTPWRVMAPGNVWLGTSAGNQDALDLRLPQLQQLGAVVYFVSGEPLLGPMTLRDYLIDWLLLGSERGPGARPPDDAWLDDLLGESRHRQVPVFLKQWQRPGARAGVVMDMPEWNGRQWLEQPRAAGWQPRVLEAPQKGCAARRCTALIPHRMLMCRRHWGMVPRDLQAAVWEHYKPGQELNGGATAEYFDAMRAAIDAVAAREVGVPHASGQLNLFGR